MKTKKFYLLAKNILFKINRSITGSGNRITLQYIKKHFLNFKIKTFNSGAKAYDWKIPHEWNVSEAYIKDKDGKRIIDFKENNLHLVGYSTKVKKKITFGSLLTNHLHTNKKQQNAIPYVTSYYKRYWGFCIKYILLKKLKKEYSKNQIFNVFINSKFKKNGLMQYGECLLKGKSKKEILISTYICHPSMANNELAGPIVSMSLLNYFMKKKLNYSMRFIFIPETIGSIAYINKNFENLKKNCIGGYNLTCLGYNQKDFGCIFSKYENNLCDKYLVQAYKILKIKYKRFSFLKRGSDERQFNSPFVDLPIATIFKSKFGNYRQYHTSLDNFDIVTNRNIESSFKLISKTIEIFQKKIIPFSRFKCEPNMGKRGLYPLISKSSSTNKIHYDVKSLMDFLQYSDGKNDLEDISKRLNISMNGVKKIFLILKNKKILEV